MATTKMKLLAFILAFFCLETGAWRIFHRGRLRLFQPPHENALDGDDQWFVQKLDHSNPTDNRTWNQRFFSNDEFYRPGGPVFLMIGGEGPANPIWMKQGNWINFAKEFNASLFYLEHRFYGKSKPTKTLDVKHLSYLSSEQALSDLAYFITRMKVERNLRKNHWFVLGGSYPGNLAAWARLKYPHLVHGAIASSAPVQAKLNFKEYLSSVGTSLGKECTEAIRTATTRIQDLLQKKDTKGLRKDLKLCDDINFNDHNDISNLFETLAGNFEGIVQYNKGNRDFEGALGTNLTIDLVCNLLTLKAGREYEQYLQVTKMILETYNQSCLDFKYSKMLKELRRVDWNASSAEGGRQWLYQTCTEFGYYQTSDDEKQPFGKNFGLDFSIRQCTDIFGKRFDQDLAKRGVERTNMQYGSIHIKSSNILFVNGAIDPWHVLSVAKNDTHKMTTKIGSILIPDTSHCADMYPPRDEDSVNLQNARRTIISTFKDWIKISKRFRKA